MHQRKPALSAFDMPGINPAHQMVILARLSEFCQFHGATTYHEKDQWEYMRRKLRETEPAITGLKAELFAATRAALLRELKEAPLTDERFADFRHLFERLLDHGSLRTGHPSLRGWDSPEAKLQAITSVLDMVQPTNLFLEERKP